MMCDRCNEVPATVHLTEIVNKKKTECHLCDTCAKQQGVAVKPVLAGSATAVGSVAHLPVVSPGKLVLKPDELAGASCPVCGMSFSDFRSTGRLGCPNCYAAFRRGLLPLLDKIHGQVEHHGKIPARATQRLERQRQVAELRRQLNEAIQREAYEQAARLRDEIYALEER